jgi:transcriptional regulator with XRE-family HTH domain
VKRRKEAPISDVCRAVKCVREAFAETQERFAQRLQVAAMTVSRFELGKKVPRNPQVLRRLQTLANEKGLTGEAALFEAAFEKSAQRRKSAVFTFSIPELACSMALDVINEDLIRPGDTLSPSEDARLRRSRTEFWYALKREQDAGWPGAPQRMSAAAQALDSIRQIRIEVLRRVTETPSAEEGWNLLNYLEQKFQGDSPPSPEETLAILRAAKQERIRKHVAGTAELKNTITDQQSAREVPGLPVADQKEAAGASSLIAEEAGPQQNKASRKSSSRKRNEGRDAWNDYEV